MKRRPKTLLHGGPAGLQPGDYLLPAATLGLPERIKTPNQPRYSPFHVHLTSHLPYAIVFARDGGAVYEAEPVGPLTPDPDARLAYRCPRARVVRVVHSFGGAA